jgi:hypothetical protein
MLMGCLVVDREDDNTRRKACQGEHTTAAKGLVEEVQKEKTKTRKKGLFSREERIRARPHPLILFHHPRSTPDQIISPI